MEHKYIGMVRYTLPEVKSVSKFDQFLRQALSDITGQEISIRTISENRDLISCISYKLANDTDLDSCDIAKWISSSLKQYWAEVELAR
jgi:hypothetical protein